MQPCSIPYLRDLRHLRENNTQEYSSNPHRRRNPQSFSQITLIIADKPQNNNNRNNHTTTINCLSLRYNAACCIPLRDLRNLRENIHISLLNQRENNQDNCERWGYIHQKTAQMQL
jgi:hypothetical protein